MPWDLLSIHRFWLVGKLHIPWGLDWRMHSRHRCCEIPPFPAKQSELTNAIILSPTLSHTHIHLTSLTLRSSRANFSRRDTCILTPLTSLSLSVTISEIFRPPFICRPGCNVLSRSWIVRWRNAESSSKSTCFWSLARKTAYPCMINILVLYLAYLLHPLPLQNYNTLKAHGYHWERGDLLCDSTMIYQ